MVYGDISTEYTLHYKDILYNEDRVSVLII